MLAIFEKEAQLGDREYRRIRKLVGQLGEKEFRRLSRDDQRTIREYSRRKFVAELTADQRVRFLARIGSRSLQFHRQND